MWYTCTAGHNILLMTLPINVRTVTVWLANQTTDWLTSLSDKRLTEWTKQSFSKWPTNCNRHTGNQSMIQWITDQWLTPALQLTDQLTDWTVRPTGWLAVDWLTNQPTDCVLCWLADWLYNNNWPSVCLYLYMSVCLFFWCTGSSKC